MKKKVLWILLLIGGVVFNLYEVKASYLSYQVKDQIEVRINGSEKATFYVVESSDSNTEYVRAIYSGVLGEEVKFKEGMKKGECQFEKSNIYEELMNRTASWTNISKVTLPTGSQILGQDFDESDMQSFRKIASNYGGDNIRFQLTGISTVPFYALNTDHAYWSSSMAPTLSDMVTDQSSLDIYPCTGYHYGQHLLYRESYLVATSSGMFAKIRPIIEVSKNHIVVPEKTTSTNPSSNRGSQTVKVANTAAGVTILVFIIGLILLGIGIFIIYYTFSKNKNKI